MKLFSVLCLISTSALWGHVEGQDTTVTYLKSLEKNKVVPSSRAQVRSLHIYEMGRLIERQLISQANNQLLQQKYYKRDRPVGTWKYFSESGELLRERDFAKVVYNDTVRQLSPDSMEANKARFLAEGGVYPEFPGKEAGLMKFLQSKIKYPSESLTSGSKGIVHITFIVDSLGIAFPSYIWNSGLDGYTDLVVWEIVESMPAWKPGMMDGKVVAIEYHLPVKFSLY